MSRKVWNEELKWKWCWRREPRGREMGELEALHNLMQGENLVANRVALWQTTFQTNDTFLMRGLVAQ